MFTYSFPDSASPGVPPSSPPPALPPRSHVMNDGDQRSRGEGSHDTFFSASSDTPPPSPDVNSERGMVVFYNKLSWFVSELPEKDIFQSECDICQMRAL